MPRGTTTWCWRSRSRPRRYYRINSTPRRLHLGFRHFSFKIRRNDRMRRAWRAVLRGERRHDLHPMRIAIVGAGIVGVTTAYELVADGHEVTVFERHATAAEEASFANAGLLGASQVLRWAAPEMLGPQKSPLILRELHWPWQRRRIADPQTLLANRVRLQQLALYSADR